MKGVEGLLHSMEITAWGPPSSRVGQIITTAKKAGEKPDPAKIQAIKEEAKVFSDEVKEIETEFKPIDQEIQSLMEWVPNMAHEDVPVARDAEGNETIRTWGTRSTFPFEPKAHWDVGKELDILGFVWFGVITGARPSTPSSQRSRQPSSRATTTRAVRRCTR